MAADWVDAINLLLERLDRICVLLLRIAEALEDKHEQTF